MGSVELKVISGDKAVLRLARASSLSGAVHSVFKHAVNLQRSDSPEIITVVSRKLADAPNTLVVESFDFTKAELCADLPVFSDGGRVGFGRGLVIDCAGAENWPEPVLRYPSDQAALCRNMEHLGMECRFIPGRNPAAVAEPLSVFAREASVMLRKAADKMAATLLKHDDKSALGEVRNILGLGLGFTPSGDDIMLGFLAAINIEGAPGRIFGHFSRDVPKAAYQATNPVSATSISLAARGRVNAVIADFLHALMYLEPPAPQLALRNVLALGSSSGADIAYGLMKGMELNLALSQPTAFAGQLNFNIQEDSYVRQNDN